MATDPTTHPDAESATVRVGGHDIHYLAAGEGPPLVLLHGGIIDAAACSWGGVLDPLARDFRVVAPDLLGYGASDVPDVTYTVERHVGVVEGLVDALGLDEPAVAGLSMGGAVALGLELDTDVAVRRLALLDSYGLGTDLPNGKLTWLLARVPAFNRVSVAILRRSRRAVEASLGNVVADPGALPPEVVDRVQALARLPDAGEAFRRFRAHEVTWAGYRTDFGPRLPDVTAPTVLVHGRADEVVPVEWSRRAADLLPESRLEVLDDCAHWPPRERPAAVAALLRETGDGEDI